MQSRLVLRGVLGVACSLLLGGSSCHVHYSSGYHDHCGHHHDHHDGCGDDTGGAGEEGDDTWDLGPWVIRQHAGLERAPEPERHPVRRVVGVRGVVMPPGYSRDARGYARAAALVIDANPGLLGLPHWAGELVVVHVARDGALIWVRFAQVWRAHGESGVGLVGVPGGGGVALGFDDLGRLVELTNTILLVPWLSPPG